jgi:peptide/nickel transport system substrate-binding protein
MFPFDNEVRLLGDVVRGNVSRRGLLKRAGALGLSVPAIATLMSAHPSVARAQDRAAGEIVYALEQAPPNMAPFGGVSQAQDWAKELVYDSLLAWDADLNIIPALAESYETPDETTYIFHLRQGVLFHNGKELVAEDVVYSFENIISPPPPGIANSFVGNIAGAEVIDDYTVQVNMTQLDPTLPGVLAWTRYTPIVPAGLEEEINTLTDGIGTGPFRVVEYVQDDRIIYEANPDFWREGVPCLSRVEFIVLSDEQARVSNLRSGEIDAAIFTADVVVTLENDEDIEVQSGLFSAPRVIQLSTIEDVPWRDKRVRQAISKVIDRQLIVDNVYAGQAEFTGAIPPGYGPYPLSDDQLRELYTVDVEGARALMEEAGYADGFSVELQAISAPREYTQIAEIVREQCAQINIDVTVQPLEIGQFAENIGNGSYQWASTGRGMRGDPAHFVIDFRSGTALHDVWFGEGWSSEEIDALYDQGIAELDQEARVPIYQQIQELIADEAPHIYTVQSYRFQGVNRRITGLEVSYDLTNKTLRTACAAEE